MRFKDFVRPSIFLILGSVLILCMEYRVFVYESIDINLYAISINGLKVSKKHVHMLKLALVVCVLISIFLQSIMMAKEVKVAYSKGYKNSSLANFVTNYIAGILGINAYGAPYGNFQPSLAKKEIKPGRFTRSNGRLTENLSIEIPTKLHLKCVASGIWRALITKSTIFGVTLISLGLWSTIEFFVNW